MTKKNILIFVAAAVILGILLGIIIGIAGGFFKQDPKMANLPKKTEVTENQDPEEEQENRDEAREKTEKKSTHAVADAEEPAAENTDDEKDTDKTDKKTDKKGTTGYIATGTGQPLNVRSAADPTSGIITSLANGTEVEVLETSNGMTHIKADGVDGWVVSDYLSQ